MTSCHQNCHREAAHDGCLPIARIPLQTSRDSTENLEYSCRTLGTKYPCLPQKSDLRLMASDQPEKPRFPFDSKGNQGRLLRRAHLTAARL